VASGQQTLIRQPTDVLLPMLASGAPHAGFALTRTALDGFRQRAAGSSGRWTPADLWLVSASASSPTACGGFSALFSAACARFSDRPF